MTVAPFGMERTAVLRAPARPTGMRGRRCRHGLVRAPKHVRRRIRGAAAARAHRPDEGRGDARSAVEPERVPHHHEVALLVDLVAQRRRFRSRAAQNGESKDARSGGLPQGWRAAHESVERATPHGGDLGSAAPELDDGNALTFTDLGAAASGQYCTVVTKRHEGDPAPLVRPGAAPTPTSHSGATA